MNRLEDTVTEQNQYQIVKALTEIAQQVGELAAATKEQLEISRRMEAALQKMVAKIPGMNDADKV